MQKLSLKKSLQTLGQVKVWAAVAGDKSLIWNECSSFLKCVSETFCSACKWEIHGKEELFHMFEGMGKIQEVVF